MQMGTVALEEDDDWVEWELPAVEPIAPLVDEPTEAEVVWEILGPDGEPLVECYDKPWGQFGFTKEPWSHLRRYYED